MLEEKEYKDYKVNVLLNIRQGIPGHLLVGHGPELKDLERRDINTTNNLSYNERQKASEITASMTYYTGKEKTV